MCSLQILVLTFGCCDQFYHVKKSNEQGLSSLTRSFFKRYFVVRQPLLGMVTRRETTSKKSAIKLVVLVASIIFHIAVILLIKLYINAHFYAINLVFLHLGFVFFKYLNVSIFSPFLFCWNLRLLFEPKYIYSLFHPLQHETQSHMVIYSVRDNRIESKSKKMTNKNVKREFLK